MEQEIQKLLAQIDRYIEESLDDNFDRYLAQMKQILEQEPERFDEVREAVERNMQRYRENVRKRDKTSAEFKVGAGVLSGIGILFVLIGFVILVKNYMPPVVQGMLMFSFFAVVWLAARLAVARFSEKLSKGLAAASVLGLYLSVIVNYHVLKTLPLHLALGLMVLVGLISWMDAALGRSVLLSVMSFGGYLFFSLFLPWGGTVPECIVMMAVIAVMNLLWHLGAAGERRELIRLIHASFFMVYSLIYGIIFWISRPAGGWTAVFAYLILMAGILNFFYCRSRSAEIFCIWLCGGIFQIALLMVCLVGREIGGGGSEYYLLLILAAVNLVLLFFKRFQWHWQGLYYQAVLLVFLVAVEEPVWPGLIAGIVLFGTGLLMIREKRLFHELVLSIYFYLYIGAQLDPPWGIPAQLAFLLVITVLCTYVSKLRSSKSAAFVYTNVSLMGLSLLWLLGQRGQANYISNTVVLVLAVAAVLLLWRERCCLPGRVRGLMLVLVLTYMVFIYQITLPVMVSLLLMGVAAVSIVVGFIRREMGLRIFGLCLALFVCAKVIVYDYWDLDLLPKSILLLVVGMIAIAISVIYAVLEQRQKKMKTEEKQNETVI